jgi:hypothetical protein
MAPQDGREHPVESRKISLPKVGRMTVVLAFSPKPQSAGRSDRSPRTKSAEIIVFPHTSVAHLRKIAEARQAQAQSDRPPQRPAL